MCALFFLFPLQRIVLKLSLMKMTCVALALIVVAAKKIPAVVHMHMSTVRAAFLFLPSSGVGVWLSRLSSQPFSGVVLAWVFLGGWRLIG